MIEKTGIPTQDLIDCITPSKERRAKGPIAVVECFQNIPCNPCYTSCKFGAMKPLFDINDKPVVDPDKCTGCGICVSHCPGLAIFIVDDSFSETESCVRIPYEFIPRPKEGQFVTGTDRSGKPVCRARVVKVQLTAQMDKTAVIWLAVPKELSMTVRCFKMEDFYDDNTIVCRCEELTLGQIRELIRKGYTSVDEIKRISRATMGPCQGRTCRPLIMAEIAKMTGKPMSEIETGTFRPPVKPIKMSTLLNGGEDDE
ncbi:MAG: (2Fe-2S)-binding protein [Oscillospiraceae bacterium]